MTRLLMVVVILSGGVALGGAPTTGPATTPTTGPATQPSHFRYLDVHIDPGGAALAAYQIEIESQTGNMNVVGIEGGEHAAFANPPFHDRIEIIKNRVVIAAYSLATDLPRWRTRVARIHVEVRGDADPRYTARLIVAGGPGAKPITASVYLTEGQAP